MIQCYVICLDVRVCFFRTVVTQIIENKNVKKTFSPPRGVCVWYMLSKSPATLAKLPNIYGEEKSTLKKITRVFRKKLKNRKHLEPAGIKTRKIKTYIKHHSKEIRNIPGIYVYVQLVLQSKPLKTAGSNV